MGKPRERDLLNWIIVLSKQNQNPIGRGLTFQSTIGYLLLWPRINRQDIFLDPFFWRIYFSQPVAQHAGLHG